MRWNGHSGIPSHRNASSNIGGHERSEEMRSPCGRHCVDTVGRRDRDSRDHRSSYQRLPSLGLSAPNRSIASRTSVFGAILLFSLIVLLTSASAQTFKGLYTFCSEARCSNGSAPSEQMVLDQEGNLYGTTITGGANGIGDPAGFGTVFELIPSSKKTKWRHKIIYSFGAQPKCADGCYPYGVIMDNLGNLYGTTFTSDTGHGIAYKLAPNARRTQWTLSVLHDFCELQGCADGSGPIGRLTYAGASSGAFYDGNSPLYGTTGVGGSGKHCDWSSGCGTAFELVPVGAGWQQTVIYDFCSKENCVDGYWPSGGLAEDASGNLYGTTTCGGRHGASTCATSSVGGTLFELEAAGAAPWVETVLHSFCAKAGCTDGQFPGMSVITESDGRLFGTTRLGGQPCSTSMGTCGVAFEFGSGSPSKYTDLYDFCSLADCADGFYPNAAMNVGALGVLFGTTYYGGGHDIDQNGVGGGTVFSLNGGLHVLYSFCAQSNCADGAYPSSLVMDGAGNLFGTTISGGNFYGGGTVFEVTP
ncbi:MAG TPA: choice-of-anchor tandem repeat GloVer-containing protein [Rhizomicrobium sp.]